MDGFRGGKINAKTAIAQKIIKIPRVLAIYMSRTGVCNKQLVCHMAVKN